MPTFAGGIHALMLNDFSTAKILISQGSEGSERLAKKYYGEGTKL
jgi:hypothetical protein